MKITAYIHPRRTAITPTGVGKHIIHMVSRLARFPGIDLSLLAANEELTHGMLDPRSPLRDLPTLAHPLPRAVMEKLWLILGHPLADRWTGPCDWVYCPAETFVPVRRARLNVTIHATYFFERDLPGIAKPSFWFKRLFEKILDRADLVTTVSQFMKGRLVELFDADPQRIEVVGNGVEPAYYAASAAPPDKVLGSSRSYVIVVGGLTWIKGAESILAVARALQNRNSDLRIVVMGHTDPRYVEQARSLPNVTDIGYKDAQLAAGIMASSVALLFLSRYESFGIPAAEAMAAGTPAVVARAGALPEVVGNAGIVVDVAKVEQIADILVNLSRNATLRERHVELGKTRAKDFTWDQCVQRLVEAMNRTG